MPGLDWSGEGAVISYEWRLWMATDLSFIEVGGAVVGRGAQRGREMRKRKRGRATTRW